MNASKAAVLAFRDTFAAPDSVGIRSGRSHFSDAAYEVLFDYYTNRAFESADVYGQYLARHNLYERTRMIYNPVTRLVDFYAGQIYPGVLSPAGTNSSDELPLAIPFNEDIDPALQQAIGQFWQWTNFQSLKSRIPRTGAMTGNVLCTVLDEFDRSRVLTQVHWPGFVKDLELDTSGNVTQYALEYQAVDDQEQVYTYRKEVDQRQIRTFKNGIPEAFGGNPPEYPNPYGFVAAVWIKHIETGTDFGAPAFHSSIPKLDELNSLASHIHDDIHLLIDTPLLIGSSSPIVPALKKPDAQELGLSPKKSRLLLKGGPDSKVAQMTGNLDLADAMPYLENLLSEIEHDHPELTFWQQLREMTQVTGPGAQRMLGDVQSKVWEAAANYDVQMIKLFQMAVAIGGWRVNRGDWDLDNSQTQKFEPFDLDSYASGELDCSILARPLVPMSEDEKVAARKAKIDSAIALKDYIPAAQILREAGYEETEIPTLVAERDKERALDMERQQELLAAKNVGQPGTTNKKPAPGQRQA